MVLPIIGAVLGGAIGAIGANKAAKTQSAAAKAASDAQLTGTRETNALYDQWRDEDIARFDPFYRQGIDSTNALNYELFGGAAPTVGGTYNPAAIETFTETTPGTSGYQPTGNWMVDAFGRSMGGTGTPESSVTRYRVGDQVFDSMDEAQRYAAATGETTGGSTYQSKFTHPGNFTSGVEWQQPFQSDATGRIAADDNALRALAERANISERPLSEFTASPAYQFRLREGLEAAQGSAAARHGLVSGASMDALNRTGQDYASNEYENWYGRAQNDWNNSYNAAQNNYGRSVGDYGRDLGEYSLQYGQNVDQYNRDRGEYGINLGNYDSYLQRLYGMAASGQNAAGQQGAASLNFGSQIGQNTMAGANATAQGLIGAGNATAAGYMGVGNALQGAIGQGIGAWQYGNMLDAFKGTGSVPQQSWQNANRGTGIY